MPDSQLPAIPGARLVKALQAAGFVLTRTHGSHHRLKHPDGRSCEPSQMSLIGLVRHMTEMKRVYGHRLAHWDIGWLYCTDST